MSRCAKWRVVIQQPRKSLDKFPAWVSGNCAISQKLLLKRSKSDGNNVTLKPTSLLVWFAIALICARTAVAADLHPIVEVQRGYLFGAIADGKWIKAEEAAKSMTN